MTLEEQLILAWCLFGFSAFLVVVQFLRSLGNEEEELKSDNKILRADNRVLERENAYLKAELGVLDLANEGITIRKPNTIGKPNNQES